MSRRALLVALAVGGCGRSGLAPPDDPIGGPEGTPPAQPPRVEGSASYDGVTGDDFSGGPNLDPAARPEIVYPLDGAVQPRNWRALTLHFRSGAGNRVFRLRVASSRLDYTLTFKPTRCDADRCQWEIPTDKIELLGLASLAVPVKLLLQGATGGVGGRVSTPAPPVGYGFSSSDVRGEFFHFSTSLPGILRMVVDRPAHGEMPAPFIVPNSASNPKDCAGCHTVSGSSEGFKIATTYGHGDDFLGVASSRDAESIALRPATIRSNFQSFSPTGNRLLTNFDGQLIVRDADTGNEQLRIAGDLIGGSGRAAMPEWSHDGQNVVMVRFTAETKSLYECSSNLGMRAGGDWLLCNGGDIAVMPLDHESLELRKTRVLVPAVAGFEYNYYPTWSPDDRWIVFNTARAPGFSPSAQGKAFSYGVPTDATVTYDQRAGRLRMVRATGGAFIDLDRATGDGDASWPKFGPIPRSRAGLRSAPPWLLTFSSHRDYGFAVTGSQQSQLWGAQIDPRSDGSDPSSAAFWLPYQDEHESNHLAQWIGSTE